MRQALGHGRAADDDLPVTQVDLLCFRVTEQHVQDSRHTMRERDLFRLYQVQQQIRFVSPGVDLFDAHECRDVRHAPAVHVKHRRDGHVDIVAVKARVSAAPPEHAHDAERVQHELPVAEVDAFGQPRGSGRIKRRRARVFVKVRESESCFRCIEHLLVLFVQ